MVRRPACIERNCRQDLPTGRQVPAHPAPSTESLAPAFLPLAFHMYVGKNRLHPEAWTKAGRLFVLRGVVL